MIVTAIPRDRTAHPCVSHDTEYRTTHRLEVERRAACIIMV